MNLHFSSIEDQKEVPLSSNCICYFAEEEVEQTVCIVQRSCVNVHTVTGKDFISPLPFQVRGARDSGGKSFVPQEEGSQDL